MGPIWGRKDPGGPYVGPMNFVIRVASCQLYLLTAWLCFVYKWKIDEIDMILNAHLRTVGIFHYNEITWALICLKSPTNHLFVKTVVQDINKWNNKMMHYCPFLRDILRRVLQCYSVTCIWPTHLQKEQIHMIIQSEVSVFPIVIIFFRGCEPEMFGTSYSVTCCIYIAGNLLSLLLSSLRWVQIVGYVLACRSYSFVCTLHHLKIITTNIPYSFSSSITRYVFNMFRWIQTQHTTLTTPIFGYSWSLWYQYSWSSSVTRTKEFHAPQSNETSKQQHESQWQ